MGRPKLISDEELIKSFDAYYIEVLRGNINYFKFSEFETYLRKQNHEGITARLLRRNEALRAHMDELKVTAESEDNPVLVFKDIDVDTVVRKSSSVGYLREFLSNLNKHYKNVYECAQMVYHENQKLKKQIKSLKEEKSDLAKLHETVKQSKKDDRTEINTLREDNRKLLGIIVTYVYPEIANAMLKEKGLLKGGSDIVDTDILSENIITADRPLNAPIKKASEKSEKKSAKKDVKSGIIVDLYNKWED